MTKEFFTTVASKLYNNTINEEQAREMMMKNMNNSNVYVKNGYNAYDVKSYMFYENDRMCACIAESELDRTNTRKINKVELEVIKKVVDCKFNTLARSRNDEFFEMYEDGLIMLMNVLASAYPKRDYSFRQFIGEQGMVHFGYSNSKEWVTIAIINCAKSAVEWKINV